MGIFSKKRIVIPKRRSENSEKINRSVLSDNFRRNSNLSGFKTENGAESPRLKVHHLSVKRQKLSGILLVVILIIAALFFLISNFTASVSISLANQGFVKNVDTSVYQKTVQDYLDANPLSRFYFFLNINDLNSYISDKLTEVDSVVQKSTVGLGVTKFEITMREPVASWKIGENQYYVDNKGVAFESNYFADPIVRVVDNSGAYLEAGQASISKRFLGFVGQVVSLSNESGYAISEAVLPPNTTRQLNIKLKDSDLIIKMTIDRSAAEQVRDMGRAVKYFAASGGTPAYIDVRVNSKVFYK